MRRALRCSRRQGTKPPAGGRISSINKKLRSCAPSKARRSAISQCTVQFESDATRCRCLSALLFAFRNHDDGFAWLALLAWCSGGACIACGAGCTRGAWHSFCARFAWFAGRAWYCGGNLNHRCGRGGRSFCRFLACAQAECGDSDQQEWIFHDISFMKKWQMRRTGLMFVAANKAAVSARTVASVEPFFLRFCTRTHISGANK